MSIGNKITLINEIYDTELRAIKEDIQWKTLLDVTLTEEQGGVLALKFEITEDISQMKEFKFYIEYPITAENEGTSVYLNANINGVPSGNNCFFSTNHSSKGEAGTTYKAHCVFNIINVAEDIKEVVGFQTAIRNKAQKGVNTRGNALSVNAPWIIPQDKALYLNVNTTATFLSGTKVYMEGR